jgi:hypothetical protein
LQSDGGERQRQSHPECDAPHTRIGIST